LITAAESEAILGVTEDDVSRWMLAGRNPHVDGLKQNLGFACVKRAPPTDRSPRLIGHPLSSDPELQPERVRVLSHARGARISIRQHRARGIVGQR
jgi:hypothetical protein